MSRTFHRRALSVAAGLALSASLYSADAAACGGFFCSQAQPVNQAAERIIFAKNGDGTVTAVIQILYQGPSESFSWLLPISTIVQEGEIGIASNVAFQRLQNATNPQYTLTTRIEGTCSGSFVSATGGTSSGPTPGAPVGTPGTGGGVTVESSGVVGEFEWTVISFDESLPDPADAALSWLEENDYDVTPNSADLIGPYLADGMYLLALKLKKGSDTGSIRPISLTYDAELPMIPIKLTAVAANDDMGVMTWILGESRAIPYNYYALELNEARINWFNASANYDEVVTAAADEAGGQGFVTEYAQATTSLSERVWSESEEQTFTQLRTQVFSSFTEMFNTALSFYGSYDGFWDAVRKTVELPDGVPFEDFRSCPSCYESQIQLSPSAFFAALDSDVIEPMRSVQALLDEHPYVTRLYSTLSAVEMTTDPLFAFNEELPDVSNLHNAERVIECTREVSQFEAPWRVALPQGTVVRGTGQQAQTRTWPTADQPYTVRVLQLSERGAGQVATDNSSLITDIGAAPAPSGGTGGTSSGGSGTSAAPGGPGAPSGGGGEVALANSDDEGCNLGGTRHDGSSGACLTGLAVAMAFWRRRAAAARLAATDKER